jgi:glutamine synthetase
MAGYSLIRPLQNQDFYYHAFDWLKEFKVDVESWHTETGPGVFEAAVAYTTSKESGDRATLFKTSMKQIGYKHGVMPSFMAKPYGDLPGCSGHMHFSLKDKQGNNVFATGEMSEQYPTMSKMMVYFLAGVLHGLPSILAILAPTINRYFIELTS